jgi:IS30 family transposase
VAKRWAITAAQREQIAELRGERGWSFRKIADHLGISYGSAQWLCLREGIEKPGPPPLVRAWSGPRESTRGNHVVRRFAPDEDVRLLSYEAAGLTVAEIGRRLGRRPNSVVGRLATLARRQERALARSDTMREEANANG